MGSFTSKKFNPETEIPDLTGKVIIVTGGNTGIGYATIRHLARRGAKVYMAARNESKATGAIKQLETEGLGKGEVVWLKLDLSDPRDAKKSAEEFLQREKRLDVLINNAAVLMAPYKKSSDGVSEIVVVNHISPFVFTRTLLPLLSETAKQPNSDVRIVNVASNAHWFTPSGVRFRNLEDLNVEYKGILPVFKRYSHSKLANILWTRELQKHLDSEGISVTTISLHPGPADSFSRRFPFPRFWGFVVGLFFPSTEVAAYTSVFAAASPIVAADREKYKGKYLTPVGKLTEPSDVAKRPELAEELWVTTEDFLKGIGL